MIIKQFKHLIVKQKQKKTKIKTKTKKKSIMLT